jgi:hypothetical protein
MAVPDTLRRKIDLYKAHGRVVRENEELFTPIGWQQVLHGQGVRPGGYHPLVDLMEEKELRDMLGDIERVIGKCVNVMPTHEGVHRGDCEGGPARYCSSLTFSIHTTFTPSSASWMAMCVIEVVGDAPCQCLWPGGHQITSPARISTMASPSHWVQPQPAVTSRVWPSGWVCQAERAPGSKVTLAHETREGAGALLSGSIRTVPVKYSSGPFIEGCEPTRLSCMLFLSFCEDVLEDRHGREHVRPAGVEGQLGQRFGRLLLGQAVVHRAVEVVGDLGHLAGRDQRADGDQAAVARRQAGTQPEVAEQGARWCTCTTPGATLPKFSSTVASRARLRPCRPAAAGRAFAGGSWAAAIFRSANTVRAAASAAVALAQPL